MEDIAKIQTNMAVPGPRILEVSANEDSEESGDDSWLVYSSYSQESRFMLNIYLILSALKSIE